MGRGLRENYDSDYLKLGEIACYQVPQFQVRLSIKTLLRCLIRYLVMQRFNLIFKQKILRKII